MKKILILITLFSLMSFSAEINASLGLNTSIPLLGGLGDEGISSDAISYTLANAGGNARLGLGLQGKIGYMYNPTTEINLSVAYDDFYLDKKYWRQCRL